MQFLYRFLMRVARKSLYRGVECSISGGHTGFIRRWNGLYQAMEWALSHPDKGFIRQPSGAYQTAFLCKRLMHRALAYIFKTRVYARKKIFLTSDDTLVKLTLYIYTHPEAFCIFIHPIPALSSQ